MEHILDLENQSEQLFSVFKKIQEGNSILFLGAGASVGEKRYLSKEIIEYYESKMNINLGESNITKFVDLLSADESFSRTQFDNFVVTLLQKLNTTEGHRILASLPWREIITTNYDLLVERAYDEINSTFHKIYDLHLIRSVKQYYYLESNTEVKFVKLNGCMHDKGLYPFAFSTNDFNKLKQFYKVVINDLKNVSPDVQFLSMGYSYSDLFGKDLLEKFDAYNYRDKRWIFNVDPFPNDSSLSFYKHNRVCIIKCSFQDFFLRYKKWEEQQETVVVKKRGLSLENSANRFISVPPRLLLNLDGIIKQLNIHTKDQFIKDIDFYKGEEPTFNIITRNVDIQKTKALEKCEKEILEFIKGDNSTFLPLVFLDGDFGIGKSTFALRVIYELEKNVDLDLIAFEIQDFTRIRKENLIDLINYSKTKNIVFYCDEVEIESHFKSLLDLQRDLSIEQFQDCNVFFLVPIRENILAKYKLSRKIPRSLELKIDGSLELTEISELLEKLRNVNLVEFRDVSEKNRLINKIQNDFNSDSFVSLMSIITSGKHERDLESSYDQLSKEAQKAFLYTALLHKHKLHMPASWLKQNIAMSWDEFNEKIVKAEGKGILIQEIKPAKGTQSDLYFRTKHPLIAAKLVDKFIPNKDKQFKFYEIMLRSIEYGVSNSFLVNDLLKTFIRSEEYSGIQMVTLYESAYTKFSDDPYFLLNYAINIQYNRRTIKELERALSLLVYAESLLERRNHKFIHRRAVISFELSKLFFEEEEELNNTLFYLREAKDLFVTKQLLDPFSSYSYVDYLKMLIWELENIEWDEQDRIQKHIVIEELFDLANRAVSDDIGRIDELNSSFVRYLGNYIENQDYKEYLDEIYDDLRLKPYACILLFNYYYKNKKYDHCDQMIDEMEYYLDNFEVVKFIFKYYGRNLFDPNFRVKLLRLSRENPNIERNDPLRFNYFNFIAETYNRQFFEGKKYLFNIQNRYNNLNPDFHYVWSDTKGRDIIFDGVIVKNSNEKYKAVKVSSIQQTVKLAKGSYDSFAVGAKVNIRLHFYLYGLIAEIIPVDRIIEENDYEE